jgi:hypothetical protein
MRPVITLPGKLVGCHKLHAKEEISFTSANDALKMFLKIDKPRRQLGHSRLKIYEDHFKVVDPLVSNAFSYTHVKRMFVFDNYSEYLVIGYTSNKLNAFVWLVLRLLSKSDVERMFEYVMGSGKVNGHNEKVEQENPQDSPTEIVQKQVEAIEQTYEVVITHTQAEKPVSSEPSKMSSSSSQPSLPRENTSEQRRYSHESIIFENELLIEYDHSTGLCQESENGSIYLYCAQIRRSNNTMKTECSSISSSSSSSSDSNSRSDEANLHKNDLFTNYYSSFEFQSPEQQMNVPDQSQISDQFGGISLADNVIEGGYYYNVQGDTNDHLTNDSHPTPKERLRTRSEVTPMIGAEVPNEERHHMSVITPPTQLYSDVIQENNMDPTTVQISYF